MQRQRTEDYVHDARVVKRSVYRQRTYTMPETCMSSRCNALAVHWQHTDGTLAVCERLARAIYIF